MGDVGASGFWSPAGLVTMTTVDMGTCCLEPSPALWLDNGGGGNRPPVDGAETAAGGPGCCDV